LIPIGAAQMHDIDPNGRFIIIGIGTKVKVYSFFHPLWGWIGTVTKIANKIHVKFDVFHQLDGKKRKPITKAFHAHELTTDL